MKTIDIKGKEYIPVNERIKEFWRIYPNGRINTNIISIENGTVVIKANVYADRTDDRPTATGTAYEQEASSFINKTSYIENCETSAVGRALGMLGIGIDTSVASSDEVELAMLQQTTIDTTKANALEKAIKNKNISDDIVNNVLEKFGYKSIIDILNVDYKRVCDELQKEAK